MASFIVTLIAMQWCVHVHSVDGLVQERRNSIVSTMELRLSCTNELMCGRWQWSVHIIQHFRCQSHVGGLMQDCSISSVLAMEILQFCTEPLMCTQDPNLVSMQPCRALVYFNHLSSYRDSHYEDKMVIRPSSVHTRNFCTGETVSWYWDSHQSRCPSM